MLMKNHQMIELPGAVSSLEDDTPIYIYSTVNIYCTSSTISELVKKYQMEEEESDGTEEDLYQDVSE